MEWWETRKALFTGRFHVEALASMLHTLLHVDEICFLIASPTDADGHRYVQFAATGHLWAEAQSNISYKGPLIDPEGEQRLLDLGWEAPSELSPNYHRRWRYPVPIGEVALLVARTLTDVFDTPLGWMLDFHFFRDSGEGQAAAGQ
jgi:hypothetical protein